MKDIIDKPSILLSPWLWRLLTLLFISILIISIFTGTFFQNPLRNIITTLILLYIIRKETSRMTFFIHKYLTAKIYSFGTQITFFEKGKYIAEYNTVHQSLFFDNENMYSFSEFDPEWVKDRFFPRGSAYISYIVDNKSIVFTDEGPDSIIYYSFNGETTYIKKDELEIVAHSERRFEGNSEIIICNKREYRVVRTNKFLSGVAKLYEHDHLIATITTGLFRQKSIFRNDMPLKERVFISLLVYMNITPIPERN